MIILRVGIKIHYMEAYYIALPAFVKLFVSTIYGINPFLFKN